MTTRELFWAAVALFLLAGYLGRNDYRDQKVIEARYAELRSTNKGPILSYPLAWDITITQSGYGPDGQPQPPRTRHYALPKRERHFQ